MLPSPAHHTTWRKAWVPRPFAPSHEAEQKDPHPSTDHLCAEERVEGLSGDTHAQAMAVLR